MKRYKLQLQSLKFVSPVDKPAQQTATALLLKRAGTTKAFADVVKLDEELGLVFCWAFTSKAAGETYWDLHGDAIDGDFVKVCAEFMEGARAVDEMHDGEQTGRCIFGMPMTAEVAKAFGVTTDTEGFMVAIKPAPSAFAKFKDGTYTGVSIEGTGIREEVSLHKRSALTLPSDGHTHLLWSIDEMMSGETSCQSMGGGSEYSRWHCHPWIKNEDGSITIGMIENHTHEVASSTEKRAPGASPVAVTIVNSTTAAGSPTVKAATHQEPNQMDATKLADRNTLLMKMLALAVAMPEAQRAHAATLTGDDLETFVGKAAGDRESIAKAAGEADAVLYTRTNGTVIRKSQGQALADVAKQADEAMALAKSEQDKRETVELAKRADTVLKHFGGDVAVRVAILKGVDAIADKATREAALEKLAAADAAMAELGRAQGVNPGGEPKDGDPLAKFNAARDAFAKANNISDPNLATEKFLGTNEGRIAKRAYDAHHPSNAARN